MIYKIAFNIIAIGMMVAMAYLQLKLFSTGLEIRRKINPFKRKLIWTDFGVVRELKRIASSTTDESKKKLISEYLKYRQHQIIILLVGILLLLMVGFLNNMFRQNQS